MKLTGHFTDISRDYMKNKFKLTVEVNETQIVMSQYDYLKDKNLDIEIKKHRVKRSNDANSYFHVLVGKLADVLKISKPRMKNILLGKYGQRETQDGTPVIISVLSEIDMLEREDLHTIPIGYGHVDGKEFTHYAVVRGSHTYDTKEMASLIDGTVQDAKDQGIETLTPAELEHMKSMWKGKSK
jgi:hypothetical protein